METLYAFNAIGLPEGTARYFLIIIYNIRCNLHLLHNSENVEIVISLFLRDLDYAGCGRPSCVFAFAKARSM